MEIKTGPSLHPLLMAGRCRSYFTSRGEGFNPADPYGGFNICHYTGGNEADTARCLSELCNATGLDREQIIIPTQTHSCRVVTVDRIPFPDCELNGCDALVTRMKDVAIGVNTADCLPVVMLDPVSGTAGVAHAGWRGAVAGIAGATVEAMRRLGSDPADIVYAIGPSICPECFEVGEEVACRFPDPVVSYPDGHGGKPHVDLQSYIKLQLARAGVPPTNGQPWTEMMCTRHHPERYFSARAAGTASGRGFTFAIII